MERHLFVVIAGGNLFLKLGPTYKTWRISSYYRWFILRLCHAPKYWCLTGPNHHVHSSSTFHANDPYSCSLQNDPYSNTIGQSDPFAQAPGPKVSKVAAARLVRLWSQGLRAGGKTFTFGNDIYHCTTPSMVILGMAYNWVYHIVPAILGKLMLK